MKKLVFIVLSYFSFLSLNAQGIHGGFSSGTQIFKVEAGYSFNENIHLGAYYSLGMDLSVYPLPSSYGAYGRYTFEKKDIFNNLPFDVSMRPYLSASIGNIHTNEILSLESSFTTDGDYETIPAKNELGYLASAGIELLYGRNSSWGSFFEIGFGKAPNYFKAISTTISNASNSNIEEPEGTGFVSFNIGFRFYFQ